MSLLTDQQVADWLNCKRSALCRWRREGRGPNFVKLGRLVRYRPEDVEDFINQGAVANQALPDELYGGVQ